VPKESLKICLASITEKTINQYNVGLKLWWVFCKQEKEHVFSPSVPSVLKFLTRHFNRGASFSSLNSYRAALAQILGPSLSEDFRIKRFFKGLSCLRPPLPKYKTTWDPTTVLNHIKQISTTDLPLELLTFKTAMLLALATGHRVQTLASIELQNINTLSDRIEIYIRKRLKTSKPRTTSPTLVLPFFTDSIICPARSVLAYIKETKPLRGNVAALFITAKKPHRAASTQTISRWLKTFLSQCGVDISVFSAHSTRHASTSAAARKGVSYENIRIAAGWSDKSKTFANFYQRPLVPSDSSFANAVLSGG